MTPKNFDYFKVIINSPNSNQKFSKLENNENNYINEFTTQLKLNAQNPEQ